MTRSDKLPRILKEPTGWVIIVLVLGFFYVQWPSRSDPPEVIDYVSMTLDNGFTVRWEAEPQQQSASNPEVWGLTRKGMSFLVQTAPLTMDFAEFVTDIAEQDQRTVGGAEQTPMEIGENFASYAYFDAESRVQEHRIYLRDGQWTKVSVLYKPSMDSRVERAADFLANVGFEGNDAN